MLAQALEASGQRGEGRCASGPHRLAANQFVDDRSAPDLLVDALDGSVA